MEQLTQDQAIALYESGEWRKWDAKTLALFQMEQDRLCVPFGEFQAAVEKTLGRPVFTHEFGLNHDGLMAELLGHGKPPSISEVLAMLPAEKLIVVGGQSC